MREALGRGLVPAVAGLLAAAAVATLLAAAPSAWRHSVSAQAQDLLLRAAASASPTVDPVPIVVVEIDAATLARVGPWPWPRARLAELVGAIAAAGPRLLVVDLLLEGGDPRAPLEELRRRGIAADDPALVALAARLPDGDAALRAALAATPVALGLGLDPEGSGAAPTAPVLTTGPVALDGLWRGAGVVAPTRAAPPDAGLGVLALPADPDGPIRRAPLLVAAGGRLYPSLALEAVRLVGDASAYVLSPDPLSLSVGATTIRLAPDGLLRLWPDAASPEPLPRLSAEALLGGARAPLAGAVVFLGASAPQAGGLRATVDDPLTPSVVVHARALRQILAGRAVVPAPSTAWARGLAPAGAALAGVALAVLLPPVLAALAVAALLLAAGAGLVALLLEAGLLVDPTTSVATGTVAFATTLVAAFARTRLDAARIRRRFEQHLSPDVVALVARDPRSLKLHGERRTITVLFTDLEDFTALTERADPEGLVVVLDAYFEGVVSLVLAHGGTVDKIVGDAVHAFFNAPLDMPGHVEAAIACAEAVAAWSNEFRAHGRAAALGLGRTRIGVETGEAIVGDVGVRAKLDYTAHGYPVNAAARLEAANKHFGSQICVGPGAAGRVETGRLRALGRMRLRGLEGEAEVFTPGP